MRRSWISVVLMLSFVVVGAVAQESSPPKAPDAPTFTPIPAPGPPGAPSIKPRPAPGSAIPYNPTPPRMAPPRSAPPSSVPPSAHWVPPQAPVKCRRVVFRLRAIPAVEAANMLKQMFLMENGIEAQPAMVWKIAMGQIEAGQIAIVPNVAGNSLLVSGPPKLVEEVGKLIDELDRPRVMVRIEIAIGEVGEKGKLEVLSRAELTTLDNQSARLQMGRREPRVVGRTVTSKGTANNVTMENVGTQLSFTPRVGPDDVVTLELDVEDSRLGPEEEGVVIATDSTGETLRTPSTRTLVCESTLSIPSGETVTLAGMGRGGESEKKRVVLVKAEVVKGKGKDEG